jgi:hypothetical protein
MAHDSRGAFATRFDRYLSGRSLGPVRAMKANEIPRGKALGSGEADQCAPFERQDVSLAIVS